MTEDEQLEQMIAEDEAAKAKKSAKAAKGLKVTGSGAGKVWGASGPLSEGDVLEGAPADSVKALKKMGMLA